MICIELFQLYNCDEHKYPVIVTIPHSGRYVPPEIRAKFNDSIVLPNMDWYLDILYDFLKGMKVTTLIANYSRYVIDLNRGLNQQNSDSDYKNSLVYAKTTFDKRIYNSPIANEDVQKRIKNYYLPYYDKLEENILKKLDLFNKVYLLDMHSFFHQANLDICLGNVDNKTSSSDTINVIERYFIREGFSVDKNEVFKGGHIIRHFHDKYLGKLQCTAIELRYTTYLDNKYFDEEEITHWNEELFQSTRRRLNKVLSSIFQEWR